MMKVEEYVQKEKYEQELIIFFKTILDLINLEA